jgi:hypothetical protein
MTHSCFASVELARDLLERGADPNAYFVNDYGRMPALYGAAGRAHDSELRGCCSRSGRRPERRRVALPRH